MFGHALLDKGHHIYCLLLIYYETEGQHAKAHEAVDHMTSILSSREEISQSGIETPTSYLRFGYLSTIVQ